MTGEPEYNAPVRCQWCHACRPVKETIEWNGKTICRDTDCLKHIQGHFNASFLSGYTPSE